MMTEERLPCHKSSFCSDSMFSCAVLIFVFICKGVVSETAVLSPRIVEVIENRSAVLTCTLNVQGNATDVAWTRLDYQTWAHMRVLTNQTCESSGFLDNENLYSMRCHGNKSFTLTILKVDETMHDVKWKCRSGFSIISNESIIQVKVPVKTTTITAPDSTVITVEEHEFYSFTCNTSYSRPTPTIKWFLLFGGNSIEINTTNTDIVSSNVKMFKSVTNVLNISLKREENGAELVCKGSNGIGQDISSRKIKMNVTYAPAGGPTIHGIVNGNTYRIKENDLGNLSCSISWGNPLPHLSWNCSGNTFLSTIDKQAVKLNLQWITERDKFKLCVCSSTHSIAGIQMAIVKINVLYPPGIPKISVSIDKGDKLTADEMINITETETINLECFSESNPKPTYAWLVNTTNRTDGNVLKLTNITQRDRGSYACYVNNLMNTTFGNSSSENNSAIMFLNILNPANVGSLKKTSLKESSTLNITCPVIPGNPSTTTIFWTRDSDNRRWNNSQLLIYSITRADDTFYKCTVLSEMVPTVGDVTKTVRSSNFHLNVFYSAKVKTFSVIGKEYKEYYVVDKTNKVSFMCTVEANPASDITIVSPKREQIITQSNINNVSHTLQNTSYANAGEYVCTGRNNYTIGEESSSKFILIVRCPPRPASGNTNDEKIATAQYVEVVLQFTARDYLDVPDKTTFKWFKDKISLESNNRIFGISSNGLQSNLSIKNITQAEFGQYGVRVTNSIGQYIHMYNVMAKDKPEAPMDFTYTNDSITDSSVALSWRPGFNGGFPQIYILLYKRITEQYWQNESITDIGNNRITYTLSDLLCEMEYQVKTYARNEIGDSAYTDILQFRTKAPVKSPEESPDSPSMVGIVAGSVSSCIIIIVVITVVVLVYRKRNRKETRREYQNVPFSTGIQNAIQRTRAGLHVEETMFEGLQEVDDVPNITKERTEYCNSPDVIDKIDRIKVTELFSYVSDRSEESFEADYQKLPSELQKPCTFARKPENIALNRYNGIYPYDHSRVKLEGQPDFFINASYIDGYKRSKEYIASLGPTAKTTSDYHTFWKMIWYEKVDVIVMLTNLREPSGMKCEKYWPEGGVSIWYGDVCVSSETTDCFAEYTIRTFSVSNDDEHRSLTHLHYTAWPDKTVPEDVTSLIEFRQRMKITTTSSDGPIIVHCSAGIGRTGTLIALDRLIEEGQDKGSLNVFECVNSMREQRVKMVQTFEQYMYIYKALVNALTFDCETIPVETFNEHVNATNNNIYSLMFQQMKQSVETDSKTDEEARRKNEKLTNKNRRGADIPGHRFRVMLYLEREEGSEYINAVYINSFMKRDYFIVAQSPLPCTVVDFITMVYQEDCSCIATMEDLKDPGMTVGQYLPDDKKTVAVGNFKVSSSRLESKNNYVVRKMKIKNTGKINSGEKTVYHFQYTKWAKGHDTPVDPREFVQFVNEIKDYAKELGEERSHVIVHCLKANERSGLFCALAILMEKIKLEQQVNVLNTLRHLRTRRQTAITSMEQLKFCYLATSEYIKMNMLE